MPPQSSEETERPEATGDIRARMRRGLVEAMKARDQQAVAALRSTLARIDNAEAVDPDGFDPDGEDAELFDADGLHDETVDAEVVDAGPPRARGPGRRGGGGSGAGGG